MLLGTALTVACTDTLVTLAKGWLCWGDERAVQEFSNGYICLECYRTVSKYSSSESYLKTELLRRNTDPEVAEIRITKRKAKRGEQAIVCTICEEHFSATCFVNIHVKKSDLSCTQE